MLATGLAADYRRTSEEQTSRDANIRLRKISGQLTIDDLKLAADWSESLEFCQRKADTCLGYEHYSTSVEDHYARCMALVLHYRLVPPTPERHDGNVKSCVHRMTDVRWWRRAVRILRNLTLENVARDIRLVSKRKGIYASDAGVRNRQRELVQTRHILENTYATNQYGQGFTLQGLADLSVSNPKVRRAELMTRLHGFETVAGLLGHEPEFYTMTTPSRMHAIRADGLPNPNYDGTTPAEANQYLAHLFALTRSKLARDGIRIYGFRVAEPHHDGTPHWHYLIYARSGTQKRIRNVFRHYALQDNPDEPGARAHRFKYVDIEKSKGTATGYIAKYISKNIDGENLETDLYGEDAKHSALRINAWASIHCIRQFQQIGGPPVSVWRELRRIEEPVNSELKAVWKASDSADWAAYVMAMGGPNLPRADRPIAPYYAHKTLIDTESGELPKEHFSRYGDLTKPPIRGLHIKGTNEKLISRLLDWTIQYGSYGTTSGVQNGHGPPRAGPQ